MNGLLVFQSDFGLVDGAVAAMTGVALSVDLNLRRVSASFRQSLTGHPALFL